MIRHTKHELDRCGSRTRGVLVDGTLRAGEARDLVRALLDQARNHHKLENLRAQVRSEAPDPGARRDLHELEGTAAELQRLLDEVGAGRVRLRATIELEVDPLAEAV